MWISKEDLRHEKAEAWHQGWMAGFQNCIDAANGVIRVASPNPYEQRY